MTTLSDRLRTWRRRFKAALPFVRRREHRVLQRKYADLIDALDAPPASSAAWTWIQPLVQPLSGEVCIFVAYTDAPHLKAHVAAHIAFLATAGLQVVLVVNTDQPPEAIVFEPELKARLAGAAVRANRGYDFGAWSHALSLLSPAPGWTRLWLVNDSVVGPLDASAFARLVERVRTSPADVVGLTEGLLPARHLQSWFLVFGPRAVHGGAVERLFGRVRNWPDKMQVIDVHETRLTTQLEAEGLKAETLFPSLSGDALSSDDTALRWAELIEAGMPYVKTRIVAAHGGDPRLKAWLAARPSAPGT
jgi:lipopolysaccharide biosynthesis protein